MNKSDVVKAIQAKTGIASSDVKLILDALVDVSVSALKKADSGERIPIVPGALVVYKVRKPAKKARQGTNPFTGEPMTFKAKPARWVVRATPRKTLKDAV